MIEQKYSTFWPRFGAGIVDGLVFIPVDWLGSFVYSHLTSVFILVPVYIINTSAFLVYSIWMHARYGQTLGKMVTKVIVLDASERPLSLRQAVLRDILDVVVLPIGLATNIPKIIYGVDTYSPTHQATTIEVVILYSTLGWFVIEILTMLTNRKRRALHDFIAGSVVIRKPDPALEPTSTAPVNSPAV
ncbi:MAG TPA: RDD family protein [Verrucomicrobiae bacterium]|jgi:uncharacterized RDD family membrane protein YckC